MDAVGSDPAVTGDWDLTAGTDTVLATGRAVAAGGSDVYVVTVSADVEPTVVGTTAGVCESDSATGDRAFANEATLTWDDETFTAEDCAEPFVNYGSLTGAKKVVGETAGFVGGDDAVFEFAWVCTTPVGDTLEGEAMVADGETKLFGDQIPVGSVCSVSETAPSGSLDNASYAWGTPQVSAESVTLTIAEPDASVTVENPVERRYGALTITKVVTGLGAADLDEDVVFSGTWGCMVEGGKRTGEWSITGAGSTVVADDLLIGSSCDVMEDILADPVEGDVRYLWGKTVIDSAVTIVAGGSELTVTNTVDRGDRLPDSEPKPEPKPEPGPQPGRPGGMPNTGAGAWGGILAAGTMLVGLGAGLTFLGRRKRRVV